MLLNKIKPLLILFLFSFLYVNAQDKKVIVKVNNPNSITLTDQLIEIPWSTVMSKAKVDPANLVVVDLATKKQIPFQLEKKGGNSVVNLLIQANLKPNEKKNICISSGKKMDFPVKAYGRFVPERKDDFAWENDKIAFRMYGKALEATPQENAYGIDVWVKRTDSLVINKRYKLAEYHIDHGDGMDYYHVGYTLGAGNMMPYANDSIYYSKNYVDYKVLDNGPLRVSFKLIYKTWNVSGKQIDATKTISLDAGSWLNKIEVDYDGNGNLPLNTVAGIVLRKQPGVKHLDEQKGILSYWEPTNVNDGTTGIALILNSSSSQMTEKEGQLLAESTTDSDGKISYYQGATWDKQGTFATSEEWLNYLYDFKKILLNPIIVSVQ